MPVMSRRRWTGLLVGLAAAMHTAPSVLVALSAGTVTGSAANGAVQLPRLARGSDFPH